MCTIISIMASIINGMIIISSYGILTVLLQC